MRAFEKLSFEPFFYHSQLGSYCLCFNLNKLRGTHQKMHSQQNYYQTTYMFGPSANLGGEKDSHFPCRDSILPKDSKTIQKSKVLNLLKSFNHFCPHDFNCLKGPNHDFEMKYFAFIIPLNHIYPIYTYFIDCCFKL